jgi:hypothetical protein
MGETHAAIDGLRRAAEDGFPCYPWFERDPCLASIRNDPEFTELMQELRIQSQRWANE